MNKIQQAFQRGKVFIPFITAGDPDLSITEQLIPAMAEAGADLIEIGIPFSDPVAEGPVIQQADERALSGGVTTDKIFDMVARVRQKTQVPLAFMTYCNPVYVYGKERFLQRMAQCGVDALIVPDLPFEEKEELAPYCKKHGVAFISLIAPTSKNRIAQIAGEAEGFVYCVSSLGVTGVRNQFSNGLKEMIQLVKKEQPIPCAVGFGVSTPQQAQQLAGVADGVIVGSAVVKLIAQHKEGCIQPVCDYVRQMKQAVQGLENR